MGLLIGLHLICFSWLGLGFGRGTELLLSRARQNQRTISATYTPCTQVSRVPPVYTFYTTGIPIYDVRLGRHVLIFCFVERPQENLGEITMSVG